MHNLIIEKKRDHSVQIVIFSYFQEEIFLNVLISY